VQPGFREFVIQGDAGARPDVREAVARCAGGAYALADDGPARRLQRTWLDTFDWRLYRAGLALEQVGNRGTRELVLTGRDGAQLAAQTLAVGQAGAGVRWPSLVGVLPAGPLRELLEPVVGVRALAPVARAVSQVREQRVLNADAKTVARLVVDRMAVTYPARAQVTPRLSVTPVRGYQAQASRIGAALGSAPGIRRSDVSALDAALAAADQLPAAKRPGLELSVGMPAATAVAIILTGLLDSVEAQVRGTIRDVDTEFLHDLRIAVRRSRSALKLAGRALPGGMAATFRPEFRWLGDLTPPTRDLDVYLLGFPALTAGLAAGTADELVPFHDYLVRTRDAAQRDLGRGLRSARFIRLTAQWRAALAEVRPARKRPAVEQFAADRIAVAHRRALRVGGQITPVSRPEALHELRKTCKDLRYLLELFGSLYDPAQRWQALRELKALQDCLGEFQDAEVQRIEIHAFADQMLAERSAPAATLLAMGEIAAGLARRQRQARAEFDGRFADFASPSSQARLAALIKVAE
jgi:CHAD domain-containing protein